MTGSTEKTRKAFSRNNLSLHRVRIQLAQTEALTPLTLLGLITGLVAGGLLIAFRELVILFNTLLIPVSEEYFEALAPELRILLPLTGAVLLVILIKLLPSERRQFGIAHVIERLTFNRGQLPISNTLGQFFSAAIALVSGFSIGREGPAVHIGAGAGSLIGQKLKLPDNTLTVLAGCGTSAAISASFNTPMAGVIFAMEVVMKEYALGSFIPVMAASVSAAVLSQMVYGPAPAFQIPLIPMPSMHELLVSVTAAFIIGALAAAFIRTNLLAVKIRGSHITRPLLAAGILMAVTGFFVPEAMGIGYDTIEALLTGAEFNAGFLLLLLLVKLFLTATIIGLGVPGGVIGPALMTGALAGTTFALLGDTVMGISVGNISFHALVGMVAMMAAVLQAPLAALVTVLEMTRNPNIIMPAMLAIIIACLTASQLFRQRGLFEMQFRARGIQPVLSPLTQHLNNTGVASLMDTHFATAKADVSVSEITHLKDGWILIEKKRRITHALHSSQIIADNNSETLLNLIGNPASRPVRDIHMQATLNDALIMMNRHSVDTLSVMNTVKIKQQKIRRLCGIITRESIENFYQHQ